MRQRDRDVVDLVLIGVMIVALAMAVVAVFGAGFSLSVASLRISVRTLFRPVVIAVSAGLVAIWRSERRQQQVAALWVAMQRHATGIAVCLAIFTFVIALRMSLFEARASDQYGYVSQAALWARGQLVTDQPLATTAPWPDATWTLSPLGYRPGQHPGTIVPTYPAGLPLLMAGFITLIGPFGAFLVVPLLGSVAVMLTFLLGKRTAGTACGLLAALLLITSPIFLYQLTEPMSDVAVTAWWLLAITLAQAGLKAGTTTAVASATRVVPSFSSAIAAGLAASAAILTRPNIVPLAVPLALFVLRYSHPQFRTRLRNALLYSAGVLPGCIAVAALNRALYGSPLASGYGAFEVLFRLDHLAANLSTYPRWLIETETPVVLLAFLAPWLMRTPMSWLFAGTTATLFACYAFYLPFDNWTYLRFLLPAIPLLLVMSSAVVLHFMQRLSSRSVWIAVGVCLALMAWRWDAAGLQPPRPNDRRFAVVGEFVRSRLPQNAIFIAMQHSGSVRYYSGRLTLRWDWMPADWLEPSLTFLRTNGYHPYLLLEDWEQPLFARRFAAHTSFGNVDWPPIATYLGTVRTDIFDPADRGGTAPREPQTIGVAGSPGH